MRARAILPQTVTGEFTPDKAWLFGFAAGDGSLWHDVVARRYVLNLAAGHDEDLAREGARTIKEVYGLDSTVDKVTRPPPRTFCWTVNCYSQAVVENMQLAAPFGIHRWRVPARIAEGSDEIAAHWLAGFFDADGCASYYKEDSERLASFDSVNPAGMDDVQKILTRLSIDHHRYLTKRAGAEETGHSDGIKIIVCRHRPLHRFYDLVPVRCARKKAILAEALSSYVRPNTMVSADLESYAPEVRRRLEDESQTYAEIGEAVGLPAQKVRWIARKFDMRRPGRGSNIREGFTRVTDYKDRIEALLSQGLSQRETAERLGLRLPSLKSFLSRLRRNEK